MKRILAIETSCDDTAVAVLEDETVLASVVSSQLTHADFGGVVPELASRLHQTNLGPVLQLCLSKAGVTLTDLHAIAFTQGPGLIGALMVGSSFAKGLAMGLGLPLLAVNHLHAHALSVRLANPRPDFPYLALTVSGGHTDIRLVHGPLQHDLLGATTDDAAGEAFDKTAKMLGLPYPGGPHLDRLAQQGDPERFTWPRAHMPGFDFSFSGLKTAVLYHLRREQERSPTYIADQLPHLCASIQHNLVTTLLEVFFRAAMQTGAQRLAIVGGVSANSALRQRFLESCQRLGLEGFVVPPAYCTDNAAMVGLLGWHLLQLGQVAPTTVVPFPTGGAAG